MRKTAVAITALMLAWALLPAQTRAVPIQTFDTSGVYEVDVAFCYGGSGVVPGPSGNAACAGDALDVAPARYRRVVGGGRDSAAGVAPGRRAPDLHADGPRPVAAGQRGVRRTRRQRRVYGGRSTGSITMRVDLGCSNGPDDILTTGGPGGALASWPDASLWAPADLVRTSQGTVADRWAQRLRAEHRAAGRLRRRTPSASSPPTRRRSRSTPSAVARRSLSRSPSRCSCRRTRRGMDRNQGLRSSTLLVGGSPIPPTDHTGNTTLPPDSQCFDSPEHLVLSSTTLKTPASDGLVPRWAMLTAAPDLRDGTRSRILDWECRIAGVGAPDADGDCLADGADLADGDSDADNDGVPDGVETAAGSDPALGDTDGDGATDYAELAQFTDATDTDSDDDGQLDRQDVIPTNTCAETRTPPPATPTRRASSTRSRRRTTTARPMPTPRRRTPTPTTTTTARRGTPATRWAASPSVHFDRTRRRTSGATLATATTTTTPSSTWPRIRRRR